MSELYAVIGGSGFYSLDADFRIESAESIGTPYGDTSAALSLGQWNGNRLVFLARHGESHQIPPHRINYRANIWALKQMQVTRIIAINAVGGIDHGPRSLILPDQIIDYSSDREPSFFDGESGEVRHIDFSQPYSQALRAALLTAARSQAIELVASGTYGCSNGPRLETSAEIRRMQRDGCQIVGMTGMPEAALARELDIEYAAIAIVVNWCSGLGDTALDMTEIEAILAQKQSAVKQLIAATLQQASR